MNPAATSHATSHADYLDPIVERHGADPTKLLQILRLAQEHHGFVHPEAVTHLCARLGLPRTKIEGVASFYSFLHLQPHGRYRVLFSDNVTDRMMGSEALMQRMCRALWTAPGTVSADGRISIGTTSCTGMCDQGPALLVNGFAVPRLNEERIDAICALVRAGWPLSAWPTEFFRVEPIVRRGAVLLAGAPHAPAGNAASAGAHGDRPAAPGAGVGDPVRAALARGRDDLLAQIRRAGLRGRGGAGFRTADKWQACRDAPGTARYVVCNADEGEPGTFKDRVLLSTRADLVFDGMAACAYVLGASRGMVYLRGEYRYLLDELEAVLRERRAAGLLGRGICGHAGFDFDIEIHVGAGAYVCGEESALLESLEGKRGTPRNRPPYPVTHGYLGQPTVVNNVETFACAALIAQRGGAWFASLGTAESTGTKLLSVSGDCPRPGVYEYPFGVPVREVLADCGAADVQAVQIGGAAGVCIAPDEFDRRIAYEDIPTAGALMVFDRSRDMFEVARNFVEFFAHESCGFCTPCRVGTTLLRNLMDKLHHGRGSPYDFGEIQKLNELLRSMSHCGLGHSACNPVLDTIERFRPAYDRRLVHGHFVPSFDLDAALAPARAVTGRQDEDAHLGGSRR